MGKVLSLGSVDAFLQIQRVPFSRLLHWGIKPLDILSRLHKHSKTGSTHVHV